MTTVIATRKAMYADSKCGSTIPFQTEKIYRIGGAIYAGCGDFVDVLKFIQWKNGGDRPEYADDVSFDVLELCKEGLFIWDKNLVQMIVNDKVYAIGSGSHYAFGALAMGAEPIEALKIAAKYDPNTGAPFKVEEL